jgi:hypothetical protein
VDETLRAEMQDNERQLDRDWYDQVRGSCQAGTLWDPRTAFARMHSWPTPQTTGQQKSTNKGQPGGSVAQFCRLVPAIISNTLQDDMGGAVDETHNPFLGEEGDPLLKKREENMQVGGAVPQGQWAFWKRICGWVVVYCTDQGLSGRSGGPAGRQVAWAGLKAGGLLAELREVRHGGWREAGAWLPPSPCLSNSECLALGVRKQGFPAWLLSHAQKRMQRRDGTMMSLAASKRANELQKDMNAWEENRLMTSGEDAKLG